MKRRIAYFPAAMLVGTFVAVPSIALFIFSMLDVTSRTLGGPWRPTHKNIAVLIADASLRYATLRTLELAIISVGLEIILGTAMAVAVFELQVPNAIERLMIIPVIASPFAVGVIWKIMFGETDGIINGILQAVHLGTFHWLSVGTAGSSWRWLNTALVTMNVSPATGILVLADAWQWSPFVMFVVLARLSAIPAHIWEAAQIDGLSRARTIFAIVLPFLRPTLTIVACIRIVDAMKMYDIVWVLFGNSVATGTLSVKIVEYGLLIRDYGRAAVVGIVLMMLSTSTVVLMIRRAVRSDP